MNDGRILRAGTPQEVSAARRPLAAEFLGHCNFLTGDVAVARTVTVTPC